MLKTFIKIHLTFISFSLKSISALVRFAKKGDGYTLPGYLLEKIPFDYLKLYFDYFDCKYVFITGTNGKTSTTSLLNHILVNSKYTVLTNFTGSNLKRGLLSTFALNFLKYRNHSPNFCVLEVDEASIPLVLKSFPKDKKFSLMVLNLSRDQLDRYGEVDLLVNKINSTLSDFVKYDLFVGESKYKDAFIKPFYLVSGKSKNFISACRFLKIYDKRHLKENFSFIYNLLSVLKISVKYEELSGFSSVEGRGNKYKLGTSDLSVNLTKNPASFNTNLLQIPLNVTNVLIYMNDNIPDGRDVSWFYDIDYKILKTALKNKNVYVCGLRSYDFFNLLKVLGISSFNFKTFKSALKYIEIWEMKDLYVLSNYSATQNAVKILRSIKNV